MSETLCPACQLPWMLIAGKFPFHSFKGETCQMSNRKPSEWLIPPISQQARIAKSALLKTGIAKQPILKTRKVRSDKGAKRGQRKKGGDSPVPERPDSTAVSGVHAAPGGPAEPGQPNELADTSGQVAQAVEQGPYKPPVEGSTPSLPITIGAAPPGLDYMATHATTSIPDCARCGGTGLILAQSKHPLIKGETQQLCPDCHPEAPKRKPRSDRAQYLAVVMIRPAFTSQAKAEAKAAEWLDGAAEGKTYTVFRAFPVSQVSRGAIQVTRIGRVRKARP